MKIKKVDIYGIRLPLKEPFVVSYARYDSKSTILVRAETDNGFVGWGEATPSQHVTSESWESTLQVIEHELAPLVIGQNPFDIDWMHQMFNKKMNHSPSAKAALDLALYDLMGKIAGQPVYRLIGGRSHEKLIVPRVMSIKSPEEMAKDAKEFERLGYTKIKIKVGTDRYTDVERIRAVRGAVSDRVSLRVDANQGWDKIDALYVIEQTKDCNIDWIEQPVKAQDLISLKEVRERSHVRIMVDEGVHTSHDMLRVIELRAADVLNIKLMKCGGIYPALSLANMAEASEIPCMIGSMVESAVGVMGNAHLAMARKIIISNGLSTPLMFSQNVADIDFDGESLLLSDKPGFGIDINEQTVKELTEHHKTVV